MNAGLGLRLCALRWSPSPSTQRERGENDVHFKGKLALRLISHHPHPHPSAAAPFHAAATLTLILQHGRLQNQRGGGWRGGHQQGVCSLCFSQGPLQQCCDEGALSGDLEMLLNTNILRGQKSLRAPPQASKPPLKEPVTSLSLSLFLSLSPIPHLSLCPRLSLSLSLTFSLSRPPSLYSFLLSSVIIPVIISSF